MQRFANARTKSCQLCLLLMSNIKTEGAKPTTHQPTLISNATNTVIQEKNLVGALMLLHAERSITKNQCQTLQRRPQNAAQQWRTRGTCNTVQCSAHVATITEATASLGSRDVHSSQQDHALSALPSAPHSCANHNCAASTELCSQSTQPAPGSCPEDRCNMKSTQYRPPRRCR